MHQNRWRLGLRPRPRLGAYSAPPDPLAGMEILENFPLFEILNTPLHLISCLYRWLSHPGRCGIEVHIRASGFPQIVQQLRERCQERKKFTPPESLPALTEVILNLRFENVLNHNNK